MVSTQELRLQSREVFSPIPFTVEINNRPTGFVLDSNHVYLSEKNRGLSSDVLAPSERKCLEFFVRVRDNKWWVDTKRIAEDTEISESSVKVTVSNLNRKVKKIGILVAANAQGLGYYLFGKGEPKVVFDQEIAIDKGSFYLDKYNWSVRLKDKKKTLLNLTRNEEAFLEALEIEGKSAKKMADVLNWSKGDVKNTASKLMRKMNKKDQYIESGREIGYRIYDKDRVEFDEEKSIPIAKGLEVDTNRHLARVYRLGKYEVIRLSQQETSLLLALMKVPVTSDNLSRITKDKRRIKLGKFTPVPIGSVKTLINTLRNKIEEDPSNPHYILTDRGKGYRLA